MEDTYRLVEQEPSVADYVMLREVAGLTPRTEEAAGRALGTALFAVCALDAAEQTVGMGRVIGDASWYVLVDIAVHPAHQRRGLGKRITSSLIDFIERDAPTGAQAMLLADTPADALYAEFGFTHSAPHCVGMMRRFPDTPKK